MTVREFRSNRPEFPLLLAGMLFFGMLFGGCASRNEILRFQENTEYIRTTLDTLGLNVQNLRIQMEGLQIQQERLAEQMVTQSDLRQYKAYMSSRLDDNEVQAQMISAQINDLSQRLTGVVQQMDELRYAPKPKPVRYDSTEVETLAVSMTSVELKELYDQAFADMSRGNYDLAKMGFEEYLRLYSDTELADNALYWIGEVEYVQHDYQGALATFQRVIEEYPKGNKLAAALFKIGLCQMTLNQ
ncbi:tetratricopeptide repeat protein, partial [bacterium]|nr:tetratricopeptide repeat protein [bacterium]